MLAHTNTPERWAGQRAGDNGAERPERSDGRGFRAPEHQTTILLIDRRALLRDCLARSLERTAGHRVVAFVDVDEWQAAALECESPIILLCIGGDSIDDEDVSRAIDVLLQAPNSPPVILLSDVEDTSQILRALESGVRGYIPTTLSLNVAIEAMHLVRAGGIFLPVASLKSFQASDIGATAAPERRRDGLTSRQTAVLMGLREGKANKVIAHELQMKESTVKVHVRNIMKKLNAKNRTEVAFKANRMFSDEKASETP